MENIINQEILTTPRPRCAVCGSAGIPLYNNQRDRLFGAPGYWSSRRCLNPKCGLIWLDPMPLESEIHKAYSNYYTHQDIITRKTLIRRIYQAMSEGYLAHFYGFNKQECSKWKKALGMLLLLFPGRRSEQNLKVMYLHNHQKGRLLEIGCGSGTTLNYFQEMGWEVEGVDFDPEAVEVAKMKGITVYQGTLEDQRYSYNTFDVITMNHLIEHVFDPVKLLHECHRILKPGGQLVIVTPNSESWGHKKFKSNWRGLEPPRHLNIFTPLSLFNITQRVGFRNTRVQTEIRIATFIFLVSRDLLRYDNVNRDKKYSLQIRIWAQTNRFFEWIRLLINPQVGEEIVVRATK